MSVHEQKRRVAVSPKDASARVLLAEALRDEGRDAESLAELERAIALDPTHARARMLQVRCLLADGRDALAMRALYEWLSLAPDTAEAHGALADLYLGMGRKQDALFHLLRAEACDPDQRSRVVGIVETAVACGLHTLARRHLERLDVLGSESAFVARWRPQLAVESGETERPVSPLLRGHAFVLARAATLLADVFGGKEQVFRPLWKALFDHDVHAARRALVILPKEQTSSPAALFARSQIAACDENHKGMHAALQRLLDSTLEGPKAAWAHRLVSEWQAFQGDLSGAIESLRSALSACPDDLELVELMGDYVTEMGHLDRAEQLYVQVARQEPGGSAAHKLAGLRRRAGTVSRASGAIHALGYHPLGGVTSLAQAAWTPGTGMLVLTGRVKGTGEEAAKLVLSYLKSASERLRLPALASRDLHVHYTDTEYEKDGPSAGLAILLAAVSALTREPLPPDLAATGELTLTGQVRAIGGVREKLMAAYLGDVRTVILPRRNRMQLDALPRELRRELTLVLVDSAEEALRCAFSPESAAHSPPSLP